MLTYEDLGKGDYMAFRVDEIGGKVLSLEGEPQGQVEEV